MSRTPRIPKYRRHKQSGQAIVTFPDGAGGRRDFLLGKHNSQESKAEYGRLVAEWVANGWRLPQTDPATADLTVFEVAANYWQHAETYYRHPDGRPTSEADNIRLALRPLKQLYGHRPAAQFDSLGLEALRAHMIAQGLCRSRINKDIARIKRLFKWAASKKLVPLAVVQSLDTVEGLRAGRTPARETEPVKPVPVPYVEAVLPFMPAQVRAMVELQLATGMRPGEVTAIRTIDIDTTGKVWLYRPGSDQGRYGAHKTAWRGHRRVVALGPKAQAVLRPWLRLNVAEPLFQPREAMAAYRAELRARRKSKVPPSQQQRRPKRRPKKGPGDRYTVYSYDHSVALACARAVAAAIDQAERSVEVRGYVFDRARDRIIRKALERAAEKGRAVRTEPEAEPPQLLVDGRTVPVVFWAPNQLRHTKATEIRREAGLDAARAVLGHRSPVVTEVYAELDVGKAAEVMERLG